jgi:hypothetical protein
MMKRTWILGLVVVMPVALASACVSNKNATPAAIISSIEAGAPPPGASSGALGVVVVDGTQKLYLPTAKTNAAGNNVVSVINVGIAGDGVNGAPALITDIDLGIQDDHPILAAGDTTMILVGSGVSRNIWIINPQNDTLVKTIQLDPSTQLTSFSTPDGYMNGIAIDSAHRKAYISIWNGFAVFDMDTMAITSTIILNPTENFAFDVVNQKLYAPFYNCEGNGGEDSGPPATCATTLSGEDAGAVMTAGLSVVDLTDGTVYTALRLRSRLRRRRPLDANGLRPRRVRRAVGARFLEGVVRQGDEDRDRSAGDDREPALRRRRGRDHQALRLLGARVRRQHRRPQPLGLHGRRQRRRQRPGDRGRPGVGGRHHA